MGIYFKNAYILTMKDDEKPFYGSLRVEGNRIVGIGDVKKEKGDQVIECNGNIIMPGFKNAHAHTAMVFGRGLTDNVNLQDWLFKMIFPMEALLEPGDYYYLNKVGILEYIQNGITSCMDMYLKMDEMESASKELGFRSVILTMADGVDVSWSENPSYAYKKTSEEKGLVTYVTGLHAEYTSDEAKLNKLQNYIKKYKLPLYTHNSETKREVEECKNRHNGMTPTEYFDSLGLFDYGGAGYHSIYLSENDMKIYKTKNIHVVSNPSSNFKLNSGICPIKKYLDYGINVGLGTDGATSNDSLDMFKEMTLAIMGSKANGSLNSKEVLKLATVGSAKAMNLNEADTLDINKLADIIMLDVNMPNMQPINDVYATIVYSTSSKNIKMTMIDGKILYQDGKFFTKENIPELYKKVSEIRNKLVKGIKL